MSALRIVVVFQVGRKTTVETIRPAALYRRYRIAQCSLSLTLEAARPFTPNLGTRLGVMSQPRTKPSAATLAKL